MNLPMNIENNQAILELEQGIYAALETYSNVHRGSGHNSMVSTHLYEQAREVVLDCLGLDKNEYKTIFCSPYRSGAILKQLAKNSYATISSKEIGLSLGVVAIAIRKGSLSKVTPPEAGGGTARLVGDGWVVWAKSPDIFEAGTPAVINVLAFAKGLQLIRKYGKSVFLDLQHELPRGADILNDNEFGDLSGEDLLEKLNKSIIGRNLKVPTTKGLSTYINLDNSASTRTITPVWNSFRNSLLLSGMSGKEVIGHTKEICCRFLGASSSKHEITFTSNTTEAINLAAHNVGRNPAGNEECVIVSTFMEHSSNDLPWRKIANSELIQLNVDKEGFLDLVELESLLRAYNEELKHGKKRIKLMAITGASNVLGTCNDLIEISSICHKYDVQILVDAAQLIAHQKIDIDACDIDFMAFSAHKIYAPFGVGALVSRKGLLNFSQNEIDQIRSMGEENLAGIAALGKALLLLEKVGMDVVRKHEHELSVYALTELAKIDGLKIHGITDTNSEKISRKVGVIAFGQKGKFPNHVADSLAREGGIGVRHGCHCAHLTVKRMLNISPMFEQFQRGLVTVIPQVGLPGVSRVSFGIENTVDDINTLIKTLIDMTIKNSDSKKNTKETKNKIDQFILERSNMVFG